MSDSQLPPDSATQDSVAQSQFRAEKVSSDRGVTSTESSTRRPLAPVIALLIAVGLISGALGAFGFQFLAGLSNNQATDPNPVQNVVINDTSSVSTVSAVAAKATPSVVTLSVSDSRGSGSGSGVIISADGYIVSNAHVVTLDGTTNSPNIQVRLSDGRLFEGSLVGTDPYSDIAVVKIDAEGLTALEFADSDRLNVGALAVAIGAPMGLPGTVTDGIISALNRSIEVASSAVPEGSGSSGGSDNPFGFWNFQDEQTTAPSSTISLAVIQTDAAINPGNSGGALVDANARLIGINVAILSNASSSSTAGSIGLGFSIPSNLVKRVAQEIIENGTASHGLLGATVSSAEARDGADREGAYVESVTGGGAAEKAGLRPGDIVIALNDIQITDQVDLTAQVRFYPAGSEVTVTYVRGSEVRETQATLGSLQ